jgi:hypothetical protein
MEDELGDREPPRAAGQQSADGRRTIHGLHRPFAPSARPGGRLPENALVSSVVRRR